MTAEKLSYAPEVKTFQEFGVDAYVEPGIGPVMAIAIPFTFALDSLVAISFLVGQSMVKGIIAAYIGLLFSFVGSDPDNFTPRLIFRLRVRTVDVFFLRLQWHQVV